MKKMNSKNGKMADKNVIDPENDHEMRDNYDEDGLEMDDNDVAEFSSDFDFEDDFFNDDSYDSSDLYLPLGIRHNSGYHSDDFFDRF